MKILKKTLLLILALLLSISVFACQSEENEGKELVLNPVQGEIKQKVDGNLVYEVLTDRMTPKLSYNQENDYDEWKEQVREKFIEKLGIDKIEKNACPLDVVVVETEEVAGSGSTPAYTKYYFQFNSEYGATVPCCLVVPNTGKASYPLAITLMGHSSSYLSSVSGRGRSIQAVERGFVALAIELRGLGTRTAYLPSSTASMCEISAMQEILLGRTILGGRVWDISKAIDALSDQALEEATANIDMSDITITGNSGGGTASFYAACYDERITLSAPSCGFCSYEEYLMSVYHCSCNLIPGAYEWFDMQDLVCLIAPRKLAIVTGAADRIFPLEGVDKAFETITAIYETEGVADNCSLTVTSRGHAWVETDVWGAIENIRNI